jgi:hypothetical protein
MLSRFNSIGIVTLVLVVALLVFCFAGSAVCGDDGGGGGGQWPDDVPPAPGGGGSPIIVTIAMILQFVL